MTVRTDVPGWTRRRWLSGVACLGLGALGADDPAAVPAPGDVEAVRRLARSAGLKKVGTSAKGHYVAVGDAPARFREEAAGICDRLAAAYQEHFRAKGLPVAFPPGKLVVVTLAGLESYEAFKGEPAAEAEGGHYDVATNRLVVFDFRDADGKGGNARKTNAFTLIHEAMHQLTYATGLLPAKGDVPVAVSEGLATYGELSPVNRPALGRLNRFRLEELTKPRDGIDWIPIDRLLTEDNLFSAEATEQLAYAESWLLVYHLLGKKATTKAFAAYLERLRTRREPGGRVADAGKAFGDLVDLDNDLKRAGALLR